MVNGKRQRSNRACHKCSAQVTEQVPGVVCETCGCAQHLHDCGRRLKNAGLGEERLKDCVRCFGLCACCEGGTVLCYTAKSKQRMRASRKRRRAKTDDDDEAREGSPAGGNTSKGSAEGEDEGSTGAQAGRRPSGETADASDQAAEGEVAVRSLSWSRSISVTTTPGLEGVCDAVCASHSSPLVPGEMRTTWSRDDSNAEDLMPSESVLLLPRERSMTALASEVSLALVDAALDDATRERSAQQTVLVPLSDLSGTSVHSNHARTLVLGAATGLFLLGVVRRESPTDSLEAAAEHALRAERRMLGGDAVLFTSSGESVATMWGLLMVGMVTAVLTVMKPRSPVTLLMLAAACTVASISTLCLYYAEWRQLNPNEFNPVHGVPHLLIALVLQLFLIAENVPVLAHGDGRRDGTWSLAAYAQGAAALACLLNCILHTMVVERLPIDFARDATGSPAPAWKPSHETQMVIVSFLCPIVMKCLYLRWMARLPSGDAVMPGLERWGRLCEAANVLQRLLALTFFALDGTLCRSAFVANAAAMIVSIIVVYLPSITNSAAAGSLCFASKALGSARDALMCDCPWMHMPFLFTSYIMMAHGTSLLSTFGVLATYFS